MPAPALALDCGLERVAGLDALEALRGEWAELWARAPGASAFEHPAWLLPWARTHAPDRSFALGVRENGRLAALMPLFTWQGAVLLAGTGPSDRGDALIEAGRPDLAELLVEAAVEAATEAGCAIVDFKQLPRASPLLDTPAPAGWSSVVEPGEPCAVAPVCGPDGLGAMTKEAARSLRQTRRRADEAGGVVIRAPARDELAAAVVELQRLHAARWNEAGEPGVLADPLTQAHLREAAPELWDAGLLRLWTLTHERAVRGALLALQTTSVLAFYVSGYDPETRALGAGTLLIAHTIEQAAAQSCVEADFLRGEEPYKLRWGAVARPTFRRVLTRTG